MAFAQQMRIEFVDIRARLAANVALPRIGFTVTAFVQEVERLIGKLDAAIRAQQVALLHARAKDERIVVGAS